MARRSYSTGEALQGEAINRLLTRFQYPAEQAQGGPVSVGGGGGAPTVVVAASDASELSKSKADFVCTGVNDNLIIQQAADLTTDGSRVLLTEGTFNFVWNNTSSGNLLDFNQGEGVMLQGMGMNTTVINVTGTPGVGDVVVLLRGTGDSVKDLRIESDYVGALQHYAIDMGANYQLISNVSGYTSGSLGTFIRSSGDVSRCEFVVVEAAEIGFDITADYMSIVGCQITVDGEAVVTTSANNVVIAHNQILVPDGAATNGVITTGSGSRVVIANNTMYAEAGSTLTSCNAFISVGTNYSVVAGNTIECVVTGPILITGSIDDVMVVDNHLAHGGAAGDDACVDAGGGWLIANNYMEGGVNGITSQTSPSFARIIGNTITDSGDHAIDLSGTGLDGVGVIGNYIEVAGAEGIHIEDTSGAASGEITVSDNQIEGCDEHGIALTNIARSLITNNLINQPGQGTDNTYDGIILAGDSDDNDIWGNKIIGSSGAPQPRYAINISASTCDDNSYLGNRSGPSGDYGTGTYNDAGTGTINTWPAAAAPQGDNLQ